MKYVIKHQEMAAYVLLSPTRGKIWTWDVSEATKFDTKAEAELYRSGTIFATIVEFTKDLEGAVKFAEELAKVSVDLGRWARGEVHKGATVADMKLLLRNAMDVASL